MAKTPVADALTLPAGVLPHPNPQNLGHVVVCPNCLEVYPFDDYDPEDGGEATCMNCWGTWDITKPPAKRVLKKFGSILKQHARIAQKGQATTKTKKKSAAKIYGPTTRSHGIVSFPDVKAAAAWCEKNSKIWFAIQRRPSGRVVVKTNVQAKPA